MKNQNTITDIKQYMSKLRVLNEQAKKEKGRKVFGLSSNIPFLIGTTALGAIPVPMILGNLFPMATLTMIPGAAIGFFAPKLVHQICLKSKGKIGQIYAKNKIGQYIDTIYKYNLLALKNVVDAKNVNQISDEDFNKFVEQATKTANTYKFMLDDYVGKVIKNRVESDYKKVINLLKEPNKNYQKIQNILDKNREFVAPWVDIYNQYGKDAKVLMQFACKFDDSLKMPKDNNFYADIDYLSKKVDQYKYKVGLLSESDLQIETNYNQRVKQISKYNMLSSKESDYSNDL
jgi:hypothetical protein